MSKKVKVGLIGAGFVGDIHHAAFKVGCITQKCRGCKPE